MNIDAVFGKFLENCEDIWKQIVSTKETETQRIAKEKIKSWSVVLGNISFVFILLLFLVWGFESVYHKYVSAFNLFGGIAIKSGYAFGILLIVFLFTISLVIKLLLYLYKWIKLVDFFKLYIYVELIFLFGRFFSAETTNQGPLITQMFNTVFSTHFFEPSPQKMIIELHHTPPTNKTVIGQ